MQITLAKVLCLDLINETPFEKDVELARTFKDDQHLLLAAKKVVENENTKVAYVISSKVRYAKYTMSEQDYINHAKRISEII